MGLISILTGHAQQEAIATSVQRFLSRGRDILGMRPVRKANEKGRVENFVGYVKKNFLHGLELPTSLSALNVAVRQWLETVATHARCYERRRDFEDPDHLKEVRDQRRRARDASWLLRFYALSPQAEYYHQQLNARSLQARIHINKI